MPAKAEARIGEMIATLEKEHGANQHCPHDADKVLGKLETLKAAGISTQEAQILWWKASITLPHCT
jgi:hypothetical protein